jgi:molybdate transport system ATP-binding protein
VTPSDGFHVDVMLDCGGTRLWSQITGLSQQQLRLQPGMRVHALIKALTIARQDVADWNRGTPDADCPCPQAAT